MYIRYLEESVAIIIPTKWLRTLGVNVGEMMLPSSMQLQAEPGQGSMP